MTRLVRPVLLSWLRSSSPRYLRPSSTLASTALASENVGPPPPRSSSGSPCPRALRRETTAPATTAQTTTTIVTNSDAEITVDTFYRRELPADLVSFTSRPGRELFRECLDAGTIENYFHLVGNFTTQTDPAFCGLGSLAMVLNALEMDPGRQWKGVWRWYSDEMLECCSPLDAVRKSGLTFAQFARLAECHGLRAEARRFDETTLDDFRTDLQGAATRADVHLVVSFSREALGQTGIGHFSPIGAFHASKDLALVLDVARFKYPSYWVSVEKLWQAMRPLDPDTGLPRGYIILQRQSTDAGANASGGRCRGGTNGA